MSLEAILVIIQLNLQIVLELLKDLTPEQKQQLWTEHRQRLEFWEKLLDRATPK
jgi:hypothetical protein